MICLLRQDQYTDTGRARSHCPRSTGIDQFLYPLSSGSFAAEVGGSRSDGAFCGSIGGGKLRRSSVTELCTHPRDLWDGEQSADAHRADTIGGLYCVGR